MAIHVETVWRRTLLLTQLVLVVLVLLGAAHSQGQTYTTVLLPQNVTIAVPRNWYAISDNQPISLDAYVYARQANAGLADFRSELTFGANYYDDSGRTAGIMNVRYYPAETITQSDSQDASPDDVRALDAELQQGIHNGLAMSGNRILAWMGTVKNSINGVVVFLSEYRRSGPNGSFRVRLVHVFDGPRSFALTVSYREDQAYFLQPITDYIIRSLRS